MLLPYFLFAALVGTSVAAPENEYDYVIIGSGPGGGSLAANLAREGHSVFLLEAGGDASDDIYQRLPALQGAASEQSPHSWQFFVKHYANETQGRRDLKYTYLLKNGSYHIGPDPPSDAEPLGLYYPRGATLGGSSQVNAMNFAWAPDNEWDHIANLTGDNSWGHQDMRELLIELENCTYVPAGTPGHGFDGYIQTSHSTDLLQPISSPNTYEYVREIFRRSGDIVPESMEQMAELFERDINRIDSDRYEKPFLFALPNAISASTRGRSSIADYINDVIDAGYPLTLSLHSLATKILTENGEDGKPKAVGVEYMMGEALYSADDRYNTNSTGETRTVCARKEVIVAGGTFNTPQILKLSGLGPRDELEQLGIPVVADIPAVGNYMMDNYEAAVQIRADQPWMNTTASPSPCTGTFDDSDPCFVEWETNATGPYTVMFGTFFSTFRTSASWDADSDLFLLSLAGFATTGFYPGYSHTLPAPNHWTTSIVKMQMENPAGTVTLQSKDPRQAPAINFNYFTHRAKEDLQALVEGSELLLNSLDAVGINYTRIEPDPKIPMEQGIMDQSFSHHATSTCRMGPAGHKDYCVDSKFRVNGVNNLRVVDASVFPRSPGAMPNGPTFTISKKAFYAIIEDA
ncbi:unnamed protein product [Periconia digitata]|uniref:Glucose-methanol-choline oxidoreductase N-terminal domain-containing protein n=1 Tax=Periconia digitata TaxID=1303443 RepID=A0A9W4U418_9PLEO|nr:unnamed protein product [Periconia digitata]